jgi:hypothetical protein
MIVGHCGLEVPVGGLLADPREKWLEEWVLAELMDLVEFAFERAIIENGMDLLVARPAQRHAVLRAAAAGFGLEMVERDQPTRHLALTQQTPRVIVHASQV